MTLPEQWPTGRQYVSPHQCHTTPSELAVKTTSTAPTHIVNTKEYYNQCGIYFHDNLTVDDDDEHQARFHSQWSHYFWNAASTTIRLLR